MNTRSTEAAPEQGGARGVPASGGAPRPEPRRVSEALFFGGFTLAVIAFLATGVASYQAFEDFSASAEAVDRSRRLIANVDSLLDAIGDLESRQRAYLLSEEPEFLLPYSDRMADVQDLLRSLGGRLADNPSHQKSFDELSRRVDAKLSVLLTAALMHSGGARERLKASVVAMDEIREVAGRMRAAEEQLLEQRLAAVESKASRSRAIIAFGSAAGLLLLLVSGGLFVRNVAVRRRLEAERDQRDAELAEAIRAAEAGNQAKSAFLAAMSHEIRTPLIGVLGMVEVLARSQLAAEQRRQLQIVHESARTLLGIIGDILDFSKIEAGKVEIEPVTVALRTLLSRVVGNYSAPAEAKGLALDMAFDEAVAAAHVVDPTRLSQIVSNWISNALKFTERGTVTVRLQSEGREAGREAIHISVADTGIGMSQEQLARLFQPFAQADVSTTRRYGGTGLGLVITRKLADLVGGAIAVDSAPGRGTTMSLRLSLAIGQPSAPPDDGFELPKPPPIETRLQPERSDAPLAGVVLLAEDHPINRKVLTLQLNLAGIQVDCAEDGTTALEMFRAGRYGLVLTDLHMPGLDGRQLTAAIREHEQRAGSPRTPIIALTANVVSGEAERCIAAGMDDYLAKPVTIDQLSRKLERWLRPLPQ